MRPEQPLTIYEIRAVSEQAFDLFDQPETLAHLGPELVGLHWETDFAFIFFAGQPGESADEFLYQHPDLDLKHVHHLTYAQWQDGAGAPPFTVAGLTITSQAGQGAEPQIIIDPGLAFGFGGHPTTLSCLEFLARACRWPDPPATALDLGTGTGVLSLAGVHWGLQKVLGIDHSHLAVAAASKNLARNHLEARVQFQRGRAQDFARHPADLLLSNLHLALQEELLALGAFQNRQFIIISGILSAEGDDFIPKLLATGLTLIDQVRTDRWITLLAQARQEV